MREALGIFERRKDVYGSLAAWPLLLVTQIFAVMFNLGILGAMLLIHLPFTEMRFGWQSTYQFSPERMHGITAALASLWKWALPQAHPTLPEITASRYSHGQSTQSLPPGAARAWWPFLACAVPAYGLLPRAGLLALAAGAIRRGLATQQFNHAEPNALFRRLTGQAITVRGGGAKLPDDPTRLEPPRPAAPVARGKCFALVAKELALDEVLLRFTLNQHFGWQVQALHSAHIDSRRESTGILTN